MKVTYKVPVDIYITVDGERGTESEIAARDAVYGALDGLMNINPIDEYIVNEVTFVEESGL